MRSSPPHPLPQTVFIPIFQRPGKDSERSVLASSIRRALQRLEARRQKIATDLQDSEAADAGRRNGDLLLANLHRLRRGMTAVTLENFTVEPPVPVTIVLDPSLSPQENAERYFRGYKKKKKGVDHAARRMKETGEEIAWLEEMAHYLEEAESREDLQGIKQELAEAGLVSAAPRNTPRTRPLAVRDTLRRILTPGGFQLWWGKSSRTNDYVSRELTGPEDLWFHAHRQPGCHLVLKRGGGREVPEEDQLFAAAIAAGYSRGRNEGKVEVMVTEGKCVRQPKGARPGLVTVERYRTLLVVPQRVADESCKR